MVKLEEHILKSEFQQKNIFCKYSDKMHDNLKVLKKIIFLSSCLNMS